MSDIKFLENSLKELRSLLVELGKFKYGNLNELEACIMCEIPSENDNSMYIKIFYRGITIRFKVVNGSLELVLGRNVEVAWHTKVVGVVEETLKSLENFRLPLHYIKFPVEGGIGKIDITESSFIEGEYNIELF